MGRKNYYKGIFFTLLALGLAVLSFSNLVFSNTGATAIPLEANPHGIAINPVTNQAVAANENADSVSIVDLETQEVIAIIPVGKEPKGVAIDRGSNIALVSNSKDNTVSVIDLNTLSVVKTIPVGKEPLGIAVNPDPESSSGHTALVANHKDDTVSVTDLDTLRVIKTIQVGKEPKDVVIDPELNLALVVNEKDYNVSVVDLRTYKVTGTVPVGQKPLAIDINPETHLAAVTNEKDNSITVINLLNWQTSSISACKHPVDIAINPLDNRALVLCDEDKTLLLIDLDTKAIIKTYPFKTYPLNKKPTAIAVNNFTNIAGVVDEKTDSLTLIQLPNPVPEITSLNPDKAERGGNEVTIEIQGNKFIKSSSASLNLQPFFIDNHHLEVTIPKEALLKAGTFPITVSNPSPEGGTSNSIGLTVNNPVPSITVLDPAEAMAGTPGLTLNIYGAGFFDDTVIYFGGIKKPAIYISNTKLQVALTSEDLKTPGQYEVMAYNSPPGGGNSNSAVFTIKSPLEIRITGPTDGEGINKARIMVKGTFKSGSQDVGITVNGVMADIIGNQWIANNVLLAPGINTITAIVKDASGNKADASISVYATSTAQAVRLSTNITSGIAPLQVYFSTSTTFTPVSYQMDFEGDGIIDYTGETFENISFTYTMEGIFYPTATITDSQGNVYSDTIAITVLSKAEIDALLKGKWEGMKGALANRDVEKAVAHFLSKSQERYRYLFITLLASLPDIAADMQNIEMISLEDGVSEYRIKRPEDAGGITYYIYFVLDGDGLWKIQQF
ncbi:MAG: hypothetical protein M1508_04835 [Nitrospirae bacterium]|nr:hypothetical protein [Nitrospirota bacterium]MCL5422391.1 hypothetical protein [Nitrospirota bacterium]